MIEILAYIIIFILFLVIIFFLVRSALIAITMLTEVPYVPSDKTYRKAIEYLDIKEGDKVVDIGCGDGRVLIYAAKKYPNAQFVGIDRNYLLTLYANLCKVLKGRKNLQFKCVNAHDFNISSFDKIYLYLLPRLIDEILLEKRNQLKKGCTVVSFRYGFGKDFFDINNTTKYPVKYRNRQQNIYKWINK